LELSQTQAKATQKGKSLHKIQLLVHSKTTFGCFLFRILCNLNYLNATYAIRQLSNIHIITINYYFGAIGGYPPDVF
jgi:hypothetical protein